ncbi:MAG: TOBE domain-containing protein, partial [bacterium]
QQISEPTAVIAGIRPEDFIIESEGEYWGTVEIIEPLGSELFVYINVKNKSLIVRTKPNENIKKGARINFKIILEKVHLFNRDDGKRIN